MRHPPHPASAPSLRLLVAEDDPLVRRMLVSAARKQGFLVSGEASNGIDAVAMTTALRPDVVLMDIEMPGISGLEATRAIQLQQPTPVVIVTAHQSPGLLQDVADSGAGAYILKPPDPSELACGIAIALARHKEMIQMKRQVSQNERRVQEVHHRVANQMGASSALLHLQALNIPDVKARTILLESENRMRVLARIHSRLQPVSRQAHLELGSFLSTLFRDQIDGLRPDLDYQEELSGDIEVSSATAITCALLVHELVMNCIRHAFSSRIGGTIYLSLTLSNHGGVHLAVKDNGRGLPEGFCQKDSTSLGLMVVRSLTRDLNGTFSISTLNPGTLCLLDFNPHMQESS